MDPAPRRRHGTPAHLSTYVPERATRCAPGSLQSAEAKTIGVSETRTARRSCKRSLGDLSTAAPSRRSRVCRLRSAGVHGRLSRRPPRPALRTTWHPVRATMRPQQRVADTRTSSKRDRAHEPMAPDVSRHHLAVRGGSGQDLIQRFSKSDCARDRPPQITCTRAGSAQWAKPFPWSCQGRV